MAISESHGSAPVEATLSAYVSWIGEALDAFGVRSDAILLGNGFGGTLALAFALDHPDRLSRLEICDAAPRFPEPGKQAFRTMAEQVAEGGMGAIADVAANRVFHAGFLEDHPVAIEERRAILLEVDPQAFRAACRILMEADLLSRLGSLKVPTLVICGALDQATPPPLNRAIAEGVPGARYIEIPACGHCPPLENPQEFLRAFESRPEG